MTSGLGVKGAGKGPVYGLNTSGDFRGRVLPSRVSECRCSVRRNINLSQDLLDHFLRVLARHDDVAVHVYDSRCRPSVVVSVDKELRASDFVRLGDCGKHKILALLFPKQMGREPLLSNIGYRQ